MAHRILIVDDEPNIVVPLEFLMKREGYEVAIAADGQAALDALEEKAPDLVILDVMLPRMSGFEVCRHIRGDARWRGLKILMLTAKGRDSEMQKGLDLGADAYVTKPFSTRDLVTRVRTMLGAKA
jgi:DNA-binding response OmpR family regulator